MRRFWNARPDRRIGIACLLALLGLGMAAAVPAAQRLPAQGTVEVAFTPWDDAERRVLDAIGQAQQALYVQAYVLTSRTIAHGLQEAVRRGVTVRLLADRDMMEKDEHSLIPELVASDASGRLAVRLEVRYGAAHNKVLLVDPEGPHPQVLTGSYNFSWSAQARNAENLLILRDHPGLAAAYLDNWRRHWDDAVPYGDARSALPIPPPSPTRRETGSDLPCRDLPVAEARLLNALGDCKPARRSRDTSRTPSLP